MFLGHFGVGFGAKKIAPSVSLGTLFLAAQFVDLLWPTLLLLGWESVVIAPGDTVVTPLAFEHYPISHSLLMSVVWGSVIGGVYYVLKRNVKGAVVIGCLVLSHWFLDLLVHRPDLPLTTAEATLVGFGLWNNLWATILLEAITFSTGIWLYLRATTATDRIGTISLWGLVAFLALIYVLNITGDPPPSTQAIAWVGHAQWLFVAWGYWTDRHRTAHLPR